MKKKVLVIVGPTASGKSDLAVKLAKRFKGEVISADSRQVYKGLDIGTGKITRKEMGGVPHHLLDVADPKKQFTVAEYKKLASEKLEEIPFPIIVGGTGFYIDVLTGAANFPDVPPNKKLRDRLSKKSNTELFNLLRKKDPKRAKNIDFNNKVRLIRALEIIAVLGSIPPLGSPTSKWEFIYIGLKSDDLEERIYKRLIKRISGIIRETKKLSYKRAYELGLEYRYAALYLKNKLNKKEMIEQLDTAIRQYAKRQMTWFSAKAGGSASPGGGKRRERNKKIKWFKPEEYREIEKYVRIALEKGD